MKNGVELYRHIAEHQRPHFEYEIGTHRYTKGDKVFYRVNIHSVMFVKEKPVKREQVFVADLPLAGIYNTRQKVVAYAKMQAGLWRIKTRLYAY